MFFTSYLFVVIIYCLLNYYCFLDAIVGATASSTPPIVFESYAA